MPLRPTELLIFGNAKAGTPLMQANQATGIDLPLKALVYEDAAGKVWLAYNDPRWIVQRHGLAVADLPAAVDAMAAALHAVATKATEAPWSKPAGFTGARFAPARSRIHAASGARPFCRKDDERKGWRDEIPPPKPRNV